MRKFLKSVAAISLAVAAVAPAQAAQYLATVTGTGTLNDRPNRFGLGTNLLFNVAFTMRYVIETVPAGGSYHLDFTYPSGSRLVQGGQIYGGNPGRTPIPDYSLTVNGITVSASDFGPQSQRQLESVQLFDNSTFYGPSLTEGAIMGVETQDFSVGSGSRDFFASGFNFRSSDLSLLNGLGLNQTISYLGGSSLLEYGGRADFRTASTPTDLLTSISISSLANNPQARGTFQSFTLSCVLGCGGPIPGVPEPASWALMIAGFGAVGAAMRRRARIRVAIG